jgi:hypothetical protein
VKFFAKSRHEKAKRPKPFRFNAWLLCKL